MAFADDGQLSASLSSKAQPLRPRPTPPFFLVVGGLLFADPCQLAASKDLSRVGEALFSKHLAGACVFDPDHEDATDFQRALAADIFIEEVVRPGMIRASDQAEEFRALPVDIAVLRPHIDPDTTVRAFLHLDLTSHRTDDHGRTAFRQGIYLEPTPGSLGECRHSGPGFDT